MRAVLQLCIFACLLWCVPTRCEAGNAHTLDCQRRRAENGGSAAHHASVVQLESLQEGDAAATLDASSPSRRHIFMSFGSAGQFRTSLLRIEREARATGWFDEVHTFTERDLGDDFWLLHGGFVRSHARGFGYWLWKPYIARQVLSQLRDGDCLWYVDAGCVLNPAGAATFSAAKRELEVTPSGQVRWTVAGYNETMFEHVWTKRDVFHALGAAHIFDAQSHVQLAGGVWGIRACNATRAAVALWYAAASNYHLLDDSASVLPNHAAFVEHRHDQSLWSIIGHLHAAHVLSLGSFFPGAWETDGRHAPIWATRLRQ